MIRKKTSLSFVSKPAACRGLFLSGLFTSPTYYILLLAVTILIPCSPVFSANVSVTWNKNTESDLAGYKIYQRTLPSQDFGQPIFSGMPSNPSSPSTTVTGLSEGKTYGFMAKAFDTSGNESAPSTEAQITLTTNPPPPTDTTPPTVTLTAPSAGAVSGTVTISASASDNVGVTGVQFRLQGANFGAEDTSSPYSTSWNTTTVPNGSYTLTAIARDAAGNTTTAASVTVTVSNTSPPPPSGSSLFVNFQPSSASVPSGYQKDDGSVYTSSRGYGWTTFVNTRERNTQADQRLDTFIHFDSGTSVTWNYDLPNGDYLVSLASGDPSWEQGPHHITIEGITVINNQTTASDQFITITNHPITIADGQLSLQLTRTSSTHTILNYVIITPASSDTTPPTVTLTAPSAGTISGTVTVSATASDNVGVAGVQFRLQGANLGAEDTSSPYSTSWNTTTVPNGSYTLTAIARDAAGNTKTAASVTVTVSNTSTPPPSANTTNILVTWNKNTESDLAGYKIYQRTLPSQDFGQPIFSGMPSNPSSPSTTVTGLSEGKTYGFMAKAFDTSGNESAPSTEAQITLSTNPPPPADTTPPTVALTAPSAGTVSGTVTVSASASDNVGVTGVQFRLQGANLGAEDTSSPYSTSWNTTTVPNGSYTLTAIARDAAGNTTIATPLIVTVANNIPLKKYDLNGDGKADLIWRNTKTGEVAGWLLNGANVASSAVLGQLPTEWAMSGMGDLNGDGKADLVWRNGTSGAVAVWLMNGLTITSTGFLGTVSTNWAIQAIEDMDGDGKADFVWRNTTDGNTAIWIMNGTTIVSTGFPAGVSLGWQITGVGDVNGDGRADVIWRHSTSSTVAVWLMNGLTITSTGFPGSAPTNWAIQAVGDLNGDGKADFVWRNTTDGNTAIWVMNGTSIAQSGFPGALSVAWQLAGAKDVNGDGKADIIWRNSRNGAVAIWLMNGLTITSTGFPGSASTDWKIQ
ncbi:MAG: Ig-like domain-containing protein [Nitrospirales bacterium]|nr:Ig-like domain-containing protein [Nitrospirales bacterium]